MEDAETNTLCVRLLKFGSGGVEMSEQCINVFVCVCVCVCVYVCARVCG